MRFEQIDKEVRYKATLSSGKGGQHVNKVATRVEVYFDIDNTELLDEEEKIRIKSKLSNKINSEGILIASSQASRSQLKNKEKARVKLIKWLEKALEVPKKRKPTKPTKGMVAARLRKKKAKSEKKANRRNPMLDL